MIESEENIKHDVLIKSRKRMEMTGISDVSSSDDGEIVVQTGNSGVSIEGENLKIEKFNSENGELILNGSINGMFYYSKKVTKKKKAITDIFK
jgi:sporulation protein YabP